MRLPEAFVERTQKILGKEFPLFETAVEQPSPVSVRVNNKMKYIPSENRVPWCDTGYYLDERPLFTADPFFHAGVYYVQEASSMFLQQVVKQYFPDAGRVLDLCAAPGGKSTLLLQTLPDDTLFVCNETVPARANILAENIIKWGNGNTVVTNNNPKAFSQLEHFFDAIVVDAPCSGEGMFRKDEEAVVQWTEKNVQVCAERQRNILSDVWTALKPGGFLVYSTCTYNKEENECNVRWICDELGAEVQRVDLNGNTQIVETGFGYRFYPHRIKGEGFFISILRKNEGEQEHFFQVKPDKKELSQNNKVQIPYSLKEPEKWKFLWDGNRLTAYLKSRADEILWLKKRLRVLYAGIEMGEVKGKDFLPSPCLAFSKYLDIDSVKKYNVDYQKAIAFLKREPLVISDTERGFILICYDNQPLGWVKNVGNRCNNFYPQEWRIRMNL